MALRSHDLFLIGRKIGIRVLVVFFLLILFPHVQADGGGVSPISANSTTAPSVLYFYGDGCVHCENIRPFIDSLSSRYPEITFRYLEVYENTTNRNYFQQIAAVHNLTPAVPTLVLGDTILVGEDQIRNGAESQIISLVRESRPGLPLNTTPVVTGNCPPLSSGLTLPLVIGGALVDSMNPCALAVLAFLLLSIITLHSRRRVLMVGTVYIAAVFILYLFSGVGLLAFIQRSGFSTALYGAAAVISFVLGLVNIIDVIRKKEGFILAIPESKKGLIERHINSASLPAAFVLGILVGIFELPCTGGIYLAILSMINSSMTFEAGLPYLLLYNLIFVLPLIVILLVVTFGLSPEQVNSWRVENRRLLRLIIGIVMVAIGVVMLLAWL